ncbi:MAG: hypothetical protein M1335_06720, partial [Chloroflexi bacterium]|nr:hypothetical protein [Chloroflexota bacterium]
MDKWGKFILRYVVAVMVVAILVVGGLIVRQIFFTPENTTPRTAAERTLMDAEETVKANPRDAKARAELARAYILIGRYNDAIDQAKIGIKLDPKNAQAFYYLGLADKNKGDNAEAMKNFTEAAKIQGTMADFKSDVYYQMGEVL